MDARKIIAQACFDPGDVVGARREFESTDQWRARAVISALASHDRHILHRDENHGPTLERAAKVAARAQGKKFGPASYQYLMATPGEVAAAIRAMEVKP